MEQIITLPGEVERWEHYGAEYVKADDYAALNDYAALVQMERDSARAEVERLRAAARALYLAGRWSAPNVPAAKQAALWERLRDAAGIDPGTATAAGVSDPTTAP